MTSRPWLKSYPEGTSWNAPLRLTALTALLDDAVRQRILEARRAGTTVTLLDEGGLDNLPEPERRRVLDELAQALLGVQTDRLIIRTVPEGSDIAVTIVGLRSVSEDAAALGALDEDAEDEVDLWLEIPRQG